MFLLSYQLYRRYHPNIPEFRFLDGEIIYSKKNYAKIMNEKPVKRC